MRLGLVVAVIGIGAAVGYATYHLRAAMPLPQTPGEVISSVAEIACKPRPRLYDTDEAAYYRQAKAVFQAYGIAWEMHPKYELDHRVPRCLGGADTDANLWPQPLAEARKKDAVERDICRQVCSLHTMSVADGQRVFLEGRW